MIYLKWLRSAVSRMNWMKYSIGSAFPDLFKTNIIEILVREKLVAFKNESSSIESLVRLGRLDKEK